MRAPALALLLIAAASSRASAQAVAETGKEIDKTVDAALIKSAAGGAAASKGSEAKKDSVGKSADPVMDKLFLICKKTGKCDDYLLEKERRKRDASRAEEGAAGRPGRAPSRGTASGGGGSASGGSSSPPTEERIEAMRQEAGERSRRTMGRATGDAETLRRSLPAGADLEEESGAAPRPEGAPGRATGRVPDGMDPTNPRTVPEMALAGRTGFAAAFDSLGLKVGAGPRGEPAIQRVDGTPATAPELEVLGAVLRSEPAALMRRPDFFEVLPREKFAALKRDYAGPPETRSPAFKDIALTDRDRDFRWSASCSALSGDCNPSAGEGSYQRGRFVSPEDLERVWNASHEGAGESDDFEEYTEDDLRLAAEEDAAAEKSAAAVRRVRGLSSLFARLGETARSWGEEAGLIASGPAAASAAGAGATGVDAGGTRSGATATGPLRVAPDMPPPVPEEGRAAKRRDWLYGLAAAAGLFAFWLRRRA